MAGVFGIYFFLSIVVREILGQVFRENVFNGSMYLSYSVGDSVKFNSYLHAAPALAACVCVLLAAFLIWIIRRYEDMPIQVETARS